MTNLAAPLLANICSLSYFIHHLKRVPCKLIINNNLIRASHKTLLIEQNEHEPKIEK